MTKEQLDAWADFQDRRWGPFKEAWFARGLVLPPSGSPHDDDTTQRGLLAKIADARPNDLGRWVREAPGSTAREIVGYILGQWDGVLEGVPA